MVAMPRFPFLCTHDQCIAIFNRLEAQWAASIYYLTTFDYWHPFVRDSIAWQTVTLCPQDFIGF